MSTIPEIGLQPTLSELPAGRNDRHGWSPRIVGLERQIRDLCTEREFDSRNIAMLADLNRTLGDMVGKLTAALDQRTNGAPMRFGPEFGISALVRDLQENERERVYLTDVSISQHQIMEGQSHHISVLTQQVADLQRAASRCDKGHSSREGQGVHAMQKLSVGDDPRISNIR